MIIYSRVKKRFCCIIFLSGIYSILPAQEDIRKFEFNGYVHYNESVITEKNWLINNTIHNRLNAKWFPDTNFTIVAEMRNRVFYGDHVRINQDMAQIIAAKTGYLDLNYVAHYSPNWIATTMLDRLYADYTYKKTQITIGRQRINWGRCIAWNPSDVFNTASYFDVDYIEKAGSDAIRIQHYSTSTNKLELAVKIDQHEKITTGLLYKKNTHNYDFQFISGILQENDLFIGLGWEGYIKNIGFRGESNYFYPYYDSNSNGIFITSIGGDYITKKDVFFQAEFIYNEYAKLNSIEQLLLQDPYILTGGGSSIVSNVKTISFDVFSALFSAQYSITPLLSTNISGMYFLESNGFFVSPNVTYSIAQNCSISIIGQYFNLELYNQRADFCMIFGLLNYNF